VVGGATVPAGSYTIFTVPAADKWTLIINKTTGEWGIPYKYESNELGAREYEGKQNCRRCGRFHEILFASARRLVQI